MTLETKKILNSLRVFQIQYLKDTSYSEEDETSIHIISYCKSFTFVLFKKIVNYYLVTATKWTTKTK